MKKLILMSGICAVGAALVIAGIILFSGKSSEDTGRFGTCGHPFAPREINIREPLFDSMKEAGVQWLRTDFVWGIIERKKGEFNFKIYDEIVSQLSERGIHMLGIITGRTYFADAYDNPDAWLAYVKATVAHFKGRVNYWEIINEHNIGESGKRKDAPKLYGALLKRAYAAIKEANPDAVVLYGGLAGVRDDYAEKSLEVCGTGSFDIMNFHAYPGAALEKTLGQYTDTLREAMAKNGGQKPIWITETGSTTPDASSSTLAIARPALDSLNLKNSKVFAIREDFIDASGGAKALFPDSRDVVKIPYADISRLGGAGEVLVLPVGQSFPYECADALVEFVKKGGTLVYQGGGYPFYFDTIEGGKSGGSKILNRLHADITPHWAIEKNMPSKSEIKNCKAAKEFPNINLKGVNDFRNFDYTAKKLKGGDKFIPLVFAKVGDKTLAVAALYKLDSDLKGNLILISSNEGNYVTEDAQAAFLARDYIFAFSHGIDKLFIYNFRSHGEVSPYEGNFGMIRKDMSRKPAFYAYQTIKKLLGDTAKPTYTETDGLCRAEWTSPDGRRVTALWTLKDKREITLTPETAVEVLNVEGKPLLTAPAAAPLHLTVTPSPTYLVGAAG